VKVVFLLAAALCGAVLSTARADAPEPADLIITNARILTMDAERRVLDRGTLVITGREITAVGEPALAERYAADTVIDADGDIVMPGMINTHNHMAMIAFRGLGEYAVEDRLFEFFFPLEKELLSRELIRVASRQAAIELALAGVTTVTDMYYHEDEVAHAVKDVGIRGVLGQSIIGFPVVDAEEPWGGLDYAVGYLEAFADDELITPALAPHAPYTVSPDKLMETKALAEAHGAPMLMHLAEFYEEKAMIRERFPEVPADKSIVGYLDELGFLGPNLLAAHVIMVDEADMAILKKRNVGVAHNPKANTKGLTGLSPAWDMKQLGIDVGLGTDGPMSSNQIDIVSVMGYAARVARVLHRDGTLFTPVDLVEMATIGGARALNMDDRIGSLEPGKLADVIIIDTASANMQPLYDPYAAVAFQAYPGDIHTTIVNGRIVARDGVVTTVDRAAHDAEWRRITDEVAAFAKTLN
jgi:cytosine/adenosine deaminase-related metal-dependent hydrolase